MELLKLVVRLATSASVGAVVKNVVDHTTPYNAKVVSQVLSAVGGFVISGVVGDHCADYVESKLFGGKNG